MNYSDVKDYVCLDIETRGMGVTCEIIEIAAVKVRGGEISQTFEELVKPRRRITNDITTLTGISNADVENARKIGAVLKDFLDFVGNDILIGHNIKTFDFKIISEWARRLFNVEICNQIIDTLDLSREISLKHHTLEQMCDYFEIKNETAHRALSDVMATKRLFEKLAAGERNPRYAQWLFRPAYRPPIRAAKLSDKTRKLLELQNLLFDVTEHGGITEADIFFVKQWLDENSEFEKDFPCAVLKTKINAALNASPQDSAFDELYDVFKYAAEPLKEIGCFLLWQGMNVCITGDFELGEEHEVEERLEKYGFTLNKSVTKKLDILLVGNLGNDLWTFGTYGEKVKKALEYRQNGAAINIVTEREFFERMGETANVGTINV